MRLDEVSQDAVLFFDLTGALVTRGPAGYVAQETAGPWLGAGARRGMLANAPAGQADGDVRWILEEAGLYDLLEPELIIVASRLPSPLPDRRAFAVAAAQAEVPVGECVFVSADPALRDAAQAAGMQAAELDLAGGGAQLAGADAVAQFAQIDEDTGPSFVLEGRVVPVDGDVIDAGRVAVSRGRIAAVLPPGEALPAEFADVPVQQTGGTIYPGLIDLHNHFVYNVLPLWTVPKRYENRTQWPRADGYSGGVSLPVRALAETPSTARALVRYVEAKALIGGTTTGQGMRTRVNGGPSMFRGAMRNVEVTDDPALAEAATRVPNLYANEEGVRSFRSGLEKRLAYFYHLSEGVDDAAHRNYEDLANNDLIRASLVGIHSLGLRAEDLGTLAKAEAKVVWSPFSNLLLYGRTLNLEELTGSGVVFAIGCDWSPTGSKNLLEELKVARWVVETQGAELSSADLVRAVTASAAKVLSWEESVGAVTAGTYADLLVLAGSEGDPFDQLIDATEAEVRLVVVHGTPRYGDEELMRALHSAPEHPLEACSIAGASKAFYHFAANSELNDLGFVAAREELEAAMADLPGFRDRAGQEQAQLASMSMEPTFTVDLDNEWTPNPDELQELGIPEAGLAADWTQMVESLPLDPPDVGAADYWERIDAQPNIEAGLKEALRGAYG